MDKISRDTLIQKSLINKTRIATNKMNTNFKILACFTRSYDTNHHDDKRIHLISSTILIR
jgi:hypothetical protein